MTPPLPDPRIPCHQFAFCSHSRARRPYSIGQLARILKKLNFNKLVEAQFAINGISQEMTKFNYLVAQLEPHFVENLWDII
ncbi:hypothetical protein LAZ67_22000643 [Cordylochernes scorpioides]|uniref:DUF7041 domain-containing protein n=1 Tax=Cordylochernes scorpioides TaxID=51811 RepID=A0ABY6LNC5_9ARAC|nr:hypothetical protein LAZ67_22000643 [Cordylochernes scorpioides]